VVRVKGKAALLKSAVLPVSCRRDADVALKPVGKMALRGEAGGKCDVNDLHFRIAQKFLCALDTAGEHIPMRRLSDGGFEGTRQIDRTNVHFGCHCFQAQVAIEVFFNVFDNTPHPPTGDGLHRRKTARP
jgi:hypothetical protein